MPLPDSTHLLLFILASWALAVTPGPAVLYVVARSISQGKGAGIVSVLGVATGDIVHISAAALGLSALLLSSVAAFTTVKYLGAAYLIYLGICALCGRTSEEPSLQSTQAQSLRQIFIQGFIVNALNPKLALFFMAFLPQFVDPAKGNTAIQVVILGLIFTLVASCSDSMYALIAGSVRQWLKGNRTFWRSQRYFSGFTYIGLGLTTAFSGSRQ